MAVYWQFGRGGTILKVTWRGGPILLGKYVRRLVELIYLCPKLCWRLAGVSFHDPCSTWRAGHQDPGLPKSIW